MSEARSGAGVALKIREWPWSAGDLTVPLDDGEWVVSATRDWRMEPLDDDPLMVQAVAYAVVIIGTAAPAGVEAVCWELRRESDGIVLTRTFAPKGEPPHYIPWERIREPVRWYADGEPASPVLPGM